MQVVGVANLKMMKGGCVDGATIYTVYNMRASPDRGWAYVPVMVAT